MDVDRGATRFSGREFGVQDLTLIRQVVDGCSGLSRMELAHTICDLLGWKRPNGSLKGRECREFLERLESRGIVGLPEKRRRRPKGSRTSVPHTVRGDPARTLIGTVREFDPIVVDQVRDRAQRLWF